MFTTEFMLDSVWRRLSLPYASLGEVLISRRLSLRDINDVTFL